MALLNFVRLEITFDWRGQPNGYICFYKELTKEQRLKIRKFLLSEIECWGVKRVNFYENKSDTYDELLAQRISMLTFGVVKPMDSPPEYILSISKEKDPTKTKVYSSDLIRVDSKVPNTLPNVEFGTLDVDGGKMDLEIICDKGYGLEDYRYCPINVITFVDSNTLKFECLEGINSQDVLDALLLKQKEWT